MATTQLSIEVRKGCEIIERLDLPCDIPIELGRSGDSHVVLDSRNVSRRHARLIPLARGYTVQNFSPNKVIHGRTPVEADLLLPWGSTITIGEFSVCIDRNSYSEADEGQSSGQNRRVILQSLIEHINLSSIDKDRENLRSRVEAALERICHERGVPAGEVRAAMITQLADEALGLGPLEDFLRDDSISEIMVIDHETIYVEQNGRILLTKTCFSSRSSVRNTIERIITPLGRRIDESSPMVDARLADGSRVNAIIPPLAIKGPCITIRKFSTNPLTMDDLVNYGTLNNEMAEFLASAVKARCNIIISGGTGSGKTTLLGVLSGSIPKGERIVTIEDAAELRLSQPHVVALESRPPNAEGKGEITIRKLLRNSLRMRPDRIVIGECRGEEALDMLQAMNTGHDGSLTTTHANTPTEAVSRIETLCLMAGIDLPAKAIREQISQAVDLIVQQIRLSDGSRKISHISQIGSVDETGSPTVSDIFRLTRTASGKQHFSATGWIPDFAMKGKR